MGPEQEEHLYRILNLAEAAIEAKYRAGAVLHGGLLPRMSVQKLLDEAINEAVDQLVYLLTLRDKL